MSRERNGVRKRRDSFPQKVPDLGYYFVVTDTKETERNYLYGLRDALPAELQGRIVIKVSSAKTKELIKACEQATIDPQYRQCWIVFDRDKVVNFDDIIREAQSRDIKIGWSNPCIEIWFDAYFGVAAGISRPDSSPGMRLAEGTLPGGGERANGIPVCEAGTGRIRAEKERGAAGI